MRIYIFASVLFGIALSIDFLPEDSCNRVGGLCVLGTECTNSKYAKGLCPKQQKDGAECCDRVPESDKRCESYGGECTNDCPPIITRRDLECKNGEKYCCIYLN